MGKLTRAWVIAIAAGATLTRGVPAAPQSADALVLIGNGVRSGSEVSVFRVASRAEAITLVSASLGQPVAQGSHGDCGQGEVIGFAKFRGGFELSFVKGRLSGWTADTATPRTSKGIGVGATLAALRKAYPDVEADPGDEANGGLGPSFQREGGPNRWLDGVKPMSRVTGLFAGATCLAGI